MTPSTTPRVSGALLMDGLGPIVDVSRPVAHVPPNLSAGGGSKGASCAPPEGRVRTAFPGPMVYLPVGTVIMLSALFVSSILMLRVRLSPTPLTHAVPAQSHMHPSRWSRPAVRCSSHGLLMLYLASLAPSSSLLCFLTAPSPTTMPSSLSVAYCLIVHSLRVR